MAKQNQTRTNQTRTSQARAEQAKEEKKSGIPQLDETWKYGIFSLLYFFLRCFYPKLHQSIDWSVPPLDRSNEILQKQFKKRFKRIVADLVIEVQLLPNNTIPGKKLIIHFEIQSTSDHFLSLRFLPWRVG